MGKPSPVAKRGLQSRHDLLGGIIAYKHPRAVMRLMENHNMSKAAAEALFEDTKLFLFICGTNADGSYGPSVEIDKGWHEFLMFTRDYRNFCNQLFGRIIDHLPNMPGEPVDKSRPRRTLQVAAQLFGVESLSPNWNYLSSTGEIKTPETILSNVEGYDVSSPCDSCGCSPCM